MAASTGAKFEAALVRGLDECGVERGDKLLVAFSGGPDSTALLAALIRLAPKLALHVEAAHFNHHLRGDESDADEQFCVEFCKVRDTALHTGGADVRAVARDHGSSVETAARELRYAFLAKTARSAGASGVTTGHTLDDQAETVLLAVARGAGLRGLSGMRHVMVRPGIDQAPPVRILRPLLSARKKETADYCRALGIKPREDSSNRDTRYARNLVRRNVMPQLARLNPDVSGAVARLAGNARDELALLDEITARELVAASGPDGLHTLLRQKLAAAGPALAKRILAAAFIAAAGTSDGLEQAHIAAMASAAMGHSGAELDLPGGIRMVVDYETVRFETDSGPDGASCPYPPSFEPATLPLPGVHRFPDGSVLQSQVTAVLAGTGEVATPWQVLLDGSLRTSGMTVRSRRDGDRFHPLGMKEEVKLQDFFVNLHVPRRWRDRVPLIETERGIAWVAGLRIAEWAKVPAGSTSALKLEYRPATTGSGPAGG